MTEPSADPDHAMPQMEHRPYVLGIDVGVASIGWAIIETDTEGAPVAIRCAGAHLFDAGVDGGKTDPETAMMQGREQSKATPRRIARSMRRQTWRRARRKRKVLGAIMGAGLLPKGAVSTPAEVDEYVKALDARLRDRLRQDGCTHREEQNLPYRLRARAAAEPVEPDEFGRAMYHLAQRRGFLSNRKTPERDGEDRSEMKQAIGDLAGHVEGFDPPTLGAYLASLDPDEERLRGRWTSRAMYTAEFDRMWKTQAGPLGLTDDARDAIRAAIFHQRPLKDQSHLIGHCSIEQGARRCPLSERPAQLFRVLSQVNHLQVVEDDFCERALTRQERSDLLKALLTRGDLSVAKARTAAGLPNSVTFSIERGGEKKLIGHRVDAALRSVFGPDRWDAMGEDERDDVVHDVRSVRETDVLRRIGRSRWALNAEAADGFADLAFEEGHSKHSRAVLVRLNQRMLDDGLAYSTARKDEYPETFASDDPIDSLPSLDKWDSDLKNPSVARAMTELRKLVNAIVRRWGKPERIHVELARDMKAGRSKRAKAVKRMRDRQKEREVAANAITTSELGISQPKRWMIEKWLLAEECGWTCPYTGREFGIRELLGREPQFDIEHIWPFSKSLDDSFFNKTICYHEENRNRKGSRTPRQAYSDEELATITDRVRKFRGDRFAVREKLRRFTDEIDADFTGRHLNETRYIGKLACDYLGLLYGGRVEDAGSEASTRRILTPSGGLTYWLRRGWGLDAVLSDDDTKNRDDHRHHAVDAIVIGCSDQGAIQRLSEAAERMERAGRHRNFDSIDEPWEGFVADVANAIESVVVSHRQSRKANGPLHKETLYSKEHHGSRRVRKELEKVSPTEIAKGKVVDKRALAVIRAKLDELGESNPAKAFKGGSNLPTIRGHDGNDVALRKVRVEVSVRPFTVGSGDGARHVQSEENHHTVVWEVSGTAGKISWEQTPVSMIEAVRRRARAEPIVNGDGGPDRRFLFSLAKGEHIEMDDPENDGQRHVYRVLAFSKGELKIIRTHDGRQSAVSGEDRTRIRGPGDGLRKLNARKVHINYLGEIYDAGG